MVTGMEVMIILSVASPSWAAAVVSATICPGSAARIPLHRNFGN